jgi:hypothetical protein
MNNETSLTNFFITLFFGICPVIPFTIVDIYYSYVYSYSCLNYDISSSLNIRIWLRVNGYMSLSSILFIFFVLSIIYNNRFTMLINFFQNNIFIKSYVFIKISFNIIWTITGSILFSKMYDLCHFNLKFYIWFRISTMFFFILLSLKTIIKQQQIFNSIETEIVNTNA